MYTEGIEQGVLPAEGQQTKLQYVRYLKLEWTDLGEVNHRVHSSVG